MERSYHGYITLFSTSIFGGTEEATPRVEMGPPGTCREERDMACAAVALEEQAMGGQMVVHSPVAPAHPGPKQGKFWTQEEDQELLEKAGRAWRGGMLKKDLVASLQPFFAQRSLEAIRKIIQKLGWPSKETPKEVERSGEAVSTNINEDKGVGVCGQPVSSMLQSQSDQQFSTMEKRDIGGCR